MNESYEESYQKERHFSFGKNWKKFLKTVNERRITEAKKSLVNSFSGEEKIINKTFIDVGCGSGLFSLAASLIGVKSLVSVDVDEYSIECAKYLRKKYEGNNWTIENASALDSKLVEKFGRFDIVYSWGVLHHTGNMWLAINNVSKLVNENGLFCIAIYNNNQKYKFEGTSTFWLKIKSFYNRTNWFNKLIAYWFYTVYLLLGITMTGNNPIKYIKNYHTIRGMNFFTDIKDWLGGYPYEFASANKIIEHVEGRGFKLKNNKLARSIGCNEFLFEKK